MEKRKKLARQQRIKSRVSLIVLSVFALAFLVAVVFLAVERALGDIGLQPTPTVPTEGSDVNERRLPEDGEATDSALSAAPSLRGRLGASGREQPGRVMARGAHAPPSSLFRGAHPLCQIREGIGTKPL